MKYLAALLALALTACNQGSDGYTFDPEKAEYDLSLVHVSVERYDNIGELRDAAKQMGVNLAPDRVVMAFGTLSQTSDDCTIHIVDPAKDYAPEWLGHELMHCLHGRWHD